MSELTRREFIRDTATLAAGATIASEMQSLSAAESSGAEFRSAWNDTPDRVWIGLEFWANPLQDWRIAGGKLECIKAAPDRHVHLLTLAIEDRPGTLRMTVQVGRTGGGPLGRGQGSFGFRIGNKGPLPDYRNALVFGTGINAGLTSEGVLFIGNPAAAKAGTVDLSEEVVELRLIAETTATGGTVTLSVHSPMNSKLLSQVKSDNVTTSQLAGGVALVANFATPGAANAAGKKAKAGNVAVAGTGQFSFSDWCVSGSIVDAHEERAFGPILFSQYTLSRGILKMTAQMPPVGMRDDQTVRLQINRDGTWQTIAEEKIHPETRTATFRLEKWDDTRDTPYRLAYTLRTKSGGEIEKYWEGTIRRDPVDQQLLTVADVSCNAHFAFPNADTVVRMAKLNPDMLVYTGDQFYESTGGYGVQRAPLPEATLDMLRKWYQHGWTWRELMRDRPSVSIPDDHDVYHGNIWGEGGAGVASGGTIEQGGYTMPQEWVNIVHRTQTAHHPDPFDPAPGKRGTSVYFGPLTYGRVSFAIIADRQFKSGPEGKVPPTGGRADHVKDPNFNPKLSDLPGLERLGERQMTFLREWAADWRGADMKAAISQTIFTAMATTHGGNREVLRADYDTNAWPQSARNAALCELRKAFAFHIAGDQHLPAVVHYGIDAHRDGPAAFAGPAVNNLYPRWFEPEKPGTNRAAGAPENTGNFRDSFDHPMTVLAVANPQLSFRKNLLEAEVDKSAGFGVVRFDKNARTITVECWPLLADPLQAGQQFPGWPVVIKQLDNYGQAPAALLPKLTIRGTTRPVVQVIDESNGETLYTFRPPEPNWQPHVFAAGKYTVRVSEPETGRMTELKQLNAVAANTATVEVMV